MPAVIETTKLTKSYGSFRGVVDVDLVVNQGEIFGFLGPNGAGKTTTIRVLLDLIRPSSGTAKVFGIEASADPVSIHRRIGYLPGEWNLYDRLTGAETIRYFGNLRGGVDKAYVDQLVTRLDLDPSRRFREYSRGNKQKVGLICALQHRPELLILDEPTAGLDPLVQQTFNELLFEARNDGRTVFLSSHIISEVERTCDRVAIIREGRIVRLDTVEVVRNLAAHEVELRFAAPVDPAPFSAVDGVTNLVAEGRMLRMLVTGAIAPVVRLAGQYELVDFVSREPSLEEVFLAEYGTSRVAADVNGTSDGKGAAR
jgi:ABC-2 type transport system ATP-binding protein